MSEIINFESWQYDKNLKWLSGVVDLNCEDEVFHHYQELNWGFSSNLKPNFNALQVLGLYACEPNNKSNFFLIMWVEWELISRRFFHLFALHTILPHFFHLRRLKRSRESPGFSLFQRIKIFRARKELQKAMRFIQSATVKLRSL